MNKIIKINLLVVSVALMVYSPRSACQTLEQYRLKYDTEVWPACKNALTLYNSMYLGAAKHIKDELKVAGDAPILAVDYGTLTPGWVDYLFGKIPIVETVWDEVSYLLELGYKGNIRDWEAQRKKDISLKRFLARNWIDERIVMHEHVIVRINGHSDQIRDKIWHNAIGQFRFNLNDKVERKAATDKAEKLLKDLEAEKETILDFTPIDQDNAEVFMWENLINALGGTMIIVVKLENGTIDYNKTICLIKVPNWGDINRRIAVLSQPNHCDFKPLELLIDKEVYIKTPQRFHGDAITVPKNKWIWSATTGKKIMVSNLKNEAVKNPEIWSDPDDDQAHAIQRLYAFAKAHMDKVNGNFAFRSDFIKEFTPYTDLEQAPQEIRIMFPKI